MTPLPAISRTRVRLAERGWPRPPRAATCAHPWCQRASGQRHHVLARSWVGIPADYIMIDKQRVIIVSDLCWHHHDALESQPGGCRARLRWLDTGWGWYDRVETPAAGTQIYWSDPDTNTTWIFKGFLKGEYRCQ